MLALLCIVVFLPLAEIEVDRLHLLCNVSCVKDERVIDAPQDAAFVQRVRKRFRIDIVQAML